MNKKENTNLKQNKSKNENSFVVPTYYTNRKELLHHNEAIKKKVNTTIPTTKANKYFYFDIDINNRTIFEDAIINHLIKNNFALTSNPNKASFFIGYNDSTYQHCINHKYKKAVSLQTMIYPSLTYGIDKNELTNKPLKKKLLEDLKKTNLNDIDKIKTDMLIIHGQKETIHPWLQAAFLYSSLKDRNIDDHSKMIIVPDINEELYNNPNKDLITYLNKQILEFFNYE